MVYLAVEELPLERFKFAAEVQAESFYDFTLFVLVRSEAFAVHGKFLVVNEPDRQHFAVEESSCAI